MPAPLEPLLFASAIEGTFVIGLKVHQLPELRQRLRDEARIDLQAIAPAYPIDDFLRGVRLVQAELLPHLPGVEGERELGAISFRGWKNTFMGRALTAITRLLGPERTMPRMTSNMRGGVNFMDITSEKLAPGRYRMTVSEVGGLPHFYAGLFEEGLRDTRAPNVRVTVRSFDGHQAIYDVTWDT